MSETTGDEGGAHGNGNGKPKKPEKVLGKEPLRPALPKRFYKSVAVAPHERGHAILLDGRLVRTPLKRVLALPTAALAEALADEWRGQREVIDPATMPLTRIANSAIDAVADQMDDVAADVAAFANSDLLYYRADTPEGLAERQRESWDPIVAWAERELDTKLVLAAGVMPVEQSPELRRAALAAVTGDDPLRLAALHVLTTLTGSAVLALALARKQIEPDAAWAAAHVDEDWQIEQWGPDAEAAERRAFRKREFDAACRILAG